MARGYIKDYKLARPMPSPMACQTCGREFRPYCGTRYCSELCRRAAKSKSVRAYQLRKHLKEKMR